MYNTPTFASTAPLAELGLRQKGAERREEGRNTKERRRIFFPSQSLINSLQVIGLTGSLSFSLARIWANQLTWQWTFRLKHTWCGPFLNLAQTRLAMTIMFFFSACPCCWSQGNYTPWSLFELVFMMSQLNTSFLLFYLSRRTLNHRKVHDFCQKIWLWQMMIWLIQSSIVLIVW